MSFKTRMEDPVRHANHRFRSRVGAWRLAMEERTLRWPTDKEREEMEEVCSIGEVPHTEKSG